MSDNRLKDQIKAVIFDQDGLMFDTERISARSWHKVEKEYGITIEEELLSRCRGSSKEDCEKLFLNVYGKDFDFNGLREKKMACFYEDIKENGLPIKKGLLELLTFLKENGYKIALATASNKAFTVKNLKESGVAEFFDICIFGDMVNKCKPDPEIFLTAASHLGEKPESCLVLEDSLNGVEAGMNGGFHVIMVPDITQPDKELSEKLSAVCESLLEVKEILEK